MTSNLMGSGGTTTPISVFLGLKSSATADAVANGHTGTPTASTFTLLLSPVSPAANGDVPLHAVLASYITSYLQSNHSVIFVATHTTAQHWHHIGRKLQWKLQHQQSNWTIIDLYHPVNQEQSNGDSVHVSPDITDIAGIYSAITTAVQQHAAADSQSPMHIIIDDLSLLVALNKQSQVLDLVNQLQTTVRHRCPAGSSLLIGCSSDVVADRPLIALLQRRGDRVIELEPIAAIAAKPIHGNITYTAREHQYSVPLHRQHGNYRHTDAGLVLVA